MRIVPHTRADIMRHLSQFMSSGAYLDPSVNVTTMAGRLYTNRVYLAEVLKDEYGQTIMSFLTCCRIEHAKMLVCKAEHPPRVKELALMSGYRSSTSFYRNFVRKEGCTPSEWIARYYASHELLE